MGWGPSFFAHLGTTPGVVWGVSWQSRVHLDARMRAKREALLPVAAYERGGSGCCAAGAVPPESGAEDAEHSKLAALKT